MEIYFKKCNTCKNVVFDFENKEIKCCEKNMVNLKANSTDAAFEKHIPNYEIINDKINISVNHVMEDNHYIMWIIMVSDSEIQYKEFTSKDEPKVTFEYKPNSTIYSYCNLHSLWMKKVKNE